MFVQKIVCIEKTVFFSIIIGHLDLAAFFNEFLHQFLAEILQFDVEE